MELNYEGDEYDALYKTDNIDQCLQLCYNVSKCVMVAYYPTQFADIAEKSCFLQSKPNIEGGSIAWNTAQVLSVKSKRIRAFPNANSKI